MLEGIYDCLYSGVEGFSLCNIDLCACWRCEIDQCASKFLKSAHITNQRLTFGKTSLPADAHLRDSLLNAVAAHVRFSVAGQTRQDSETLVGVMHSAKYILKADSYGPHQAMEVYQATSL